MKLKGFLKSLGKTKKPDRKVKEPDPAQCK